MSIAVWKAYAEGNAYVIVDDERAVPRVLPWVTDPARGLGGDGVLLAHWRDRETVGMSVFNADGTTAPACGNGARCLAALAIRSGRATGDTVVTVISSGLSIQHHLRSRSPWRLSQAVDIPSDPVVWEGDNATQIDLGTPHRVVFGQVASIDLPTAGPLAERAWPGRTNVMFTEVTAAGRIQVTPWERGVGATRGCATGAAAAAIATARRYPDWPQRCTVDQPGGSIEVTFRPGSLTIEGTVYFVAGGRLWV